MEKFAAEPIKNVEDVNKILSYFDSNNQHRNKLLFVIGINSGLRLSDILALKFKDLLNEDCSIKSKVNIHENRTGSVYGFYVNDCIAGAFTEYVKTLDSVNMDDLIFSNISINSVEHMLKKVVNDELGIDIHVGSHTMRKTFAYHVVSDAPDKIRAVDMIQKMFGHKSPVTTLYYAGITGKEIQSVCLN